MSNTLNLKRNYLKSIEEEDIPKPRPKSNKLFKLIISLIIIFIIIFISLIGFYFYSNSRELNALNLDINNYNSLISQVRSNNNQTSADATSYSEQFTNLANSFKKLQASNFIGNSNKTIASNYNALATYLASQETLTSSYLNIVSEAKSLNKSNLNDIQSFISNFNKLLSTNDFTQMTNLYNNNTFVQGHINETESPVQFKSLVDTAVKKLSTLSKYEVMANNVSNFFGFGDIFANSYSK